MRIRHKSAVDQCQIRSSKTSAPDLLVWCESAVNSQRRISRIFRCKLLWIRIESAGHGIRFSRNKKEKKWQMLGSILEPHALSACALPLHHRCTRWYGEDFIFLSSPASWSHGAVQTIPTVVTTAIPDGMLGTRLHGQPRSFTPRPAKAPLWSCLFSKTLRNWLTPLAPLPFEGYWSCDADAGLLETLMKVIQLFFTTAQVNSKCSDQLGSFIVTVTNQFRPRSSQVELCGHWVPVLGINLGSRLLYCCDLCKIVHQNM